MKGNTAKKAHGGRKERIFFVDLSVAVTVNSEVNIDAMTGEARDEMLYEMAKDRIAIGDMGDVESIEEEEIV